MFEARDIAYRLPDFGLSLSLDLGPGETGVLLGASGAGKTTLLRLIAGFLRPEGGSLSLGGRRIEGLPPEKRGVGIVFQGDALFPTMSVRANIAYGPRLAGRGRGERKKLVEELAGSMGLGGLLERMPRDLSGGERQRVALARTLAASPSLLLFDEALGSLDPDSRAALARVIRLKTKDAGLPSLHVTHDAAEALALADTVFMMDRGRIVEAGEPRRLYESPQSLVTARYFGAGPLLPLRGSEGGDWLTEAGRFSMRDGGEAGRCGSGSCLFFPSSRAGILPESAPAMTRNSLAVEVVESVYRGSWTGILARVVGLQVEFRLELDSGVRAEAGDRLRLGIDPESLRVLGPDRGGFSPPVPRCRTP